MSSDIGARMSVLRKLYGWSQRQLAKRAGVPHSAISMIEHGQVSPSVNSLKKVLDGVPMSLADFFSLSLAPAPRAFFKAEHLEFAGNEKVEQFILRSSFHLGLHALRECLPPGVEIGADSSAKYGEWMGFVVEGSLELTIGGDSEQLHKGDGFVVDTRRPYCFHNNTDEPCELVRIAVNKESDIKQ